MLQVKDSAMPDFTRFLRFLPLAMAGLMGLLAFNPGFLQWLETRVGFVALTGLIAAAGYVAWRMALSQHRSGQQP